jgi:hypothetical protein
MTYQEATIPRKHKQWKITIIIWRKEKYGSKFEKWLKIVTFLWILSWRKTLTWERLLVRGFEFHP